MVAITLIPFSSPMQKVRFRGLTLWLGTKGITRTGKDFLQLSPEQIKECKPLKQTPMEQFSDKMLHKALNHIGMRGGGRKFMEKAIRNLDPTHKILIQTFLDKRPPRPPKPLPLNAPFAPEWITHKKKRNKTIARIYAHLKGRMRNPPPKMTQMIELRLFVGAPSPEAYADPKTLPKRVEALGKQMLRRLKPLKA